jgi:hypothetical protein
MKIESVVLENFATAFSSNSSGCVRTCACGRQFYDTANTYDWEEGEFEKLCADPQAVALPHAVGTLVIQGVEFCEDCTCWYATAKPLIKLFHSQPRQIARYFELEKQRKERLAAAFPMISN